MDLQPDNGFVFQGMILTDSSPIFGHSTLCPYEYGE